MLGVQVLHPGARRQGVGVIGQSHTGGFLGAQHLLAPGIDIALPGFDPHLLAGLRINAPTLSSRAGLALWYALLTAGPGNEGGCSAGLVLLLEGGNAVVTLGLLVVELVLLRVDNDHGVTNSPGQLLLTGTLDGHVGNKITDLTHLSLGVGHDFHSVVLRIRPFRIEPLQSFQRLGGFDPGLAAMRNDHHAIPVEVGTAESFRNAGVNTDSIGHLPKSSASLLVAVVDDELGDLESTAMRITNE